jgi:hypothetical protein
MKSKFHNKKSSGFEKEVGPALAKKHKLSKVLPISYTSHHKYTADYVIHNEKDNTTVYIEVKGRFRTSAEAAKYIDIARHLKHNESLVFIFMYPDRVMLNYKSQTYREWAAKHGFEVWEL